MLRRVLFLDIDGVLNHETFWRARQHYLNKKDYFRYNIDEVSLYCLFDTLEYIGGIDIVISSTWRHRFTSEKIKNEILSKFGISLNIIDSTSRGRNLTIEGVNYVNKYNISINTYNNVRGVQIINWLGVHDNYSKVAALDDDDDIPKSMLVMTDFKTGFNAISADELVMKLK